MPRKRFGSGKRSRAPSRMRLKVEPSICPRGSSQMFRMQVRHSRLHRLVARCKTLATSSLQIRRPTPFPPFSRKIFVPGFRPYRATTSEGGSPSPDCLFLWKILVSLSSKKPPLFSIHQPDEIEADEDDEDPAPLPQVSEAGIQSFGLDNPFGEPMEVPAIRIKRQWPKAYMKRSKPP